MNSETDVCSECGGVTRLIRGKRAATCGRRCRTALAVRLFREANPSSGFPPSEAGYLAESVAITDLLRRRIQVFRQVGQNGIDLVLLHAGRLIGVEVRTGTIGRNGQLQFQRRIGRTHGLVPMFAIVVGPGQAVPQVFYVEHDGKTVEW